MAMTVPRHAPKKIQRTVSISITYIPFDQLRRSSSFARISDGAMMCRGTTNTTKADSLRTGRRGTNERTLVHGETAWDAPLPPCGRLSLFHASFHVLRHGRLHRDLHRPLRMRVLGTITQVSQIIKQVGAHYPRNTFTGLMISTLVTSSR